jgi:hypothetical protein
MVSRKRNCKYEIIQINRLCPVTMSTFSRDPSCFVSTEQQIAKYTGPYSPTAV